MDQTSQRKDATLEEIDWARDRAITYQLERLRKLKSTLCTEMLALNEYKIVLDSYVDAKDVDNTSLLEMWLDYIMLLRKTSSDYGFIISTFERLKQNRVCHHRAKLYICWAETLAEKGHVSKACLILQAALGSKVEPADELRKYLTTISPKPGSHLNPDAFNRLKDHMISELMESKYHSSPTDKQHASPDSNGAGSVRRVFNFGRLNIGSPPVRVASSYNHLNDRVPILAHSPTNAKHKSTSPMLNVPSSSRENHLKRHLNSDTEENHNSENSSYNKREQKTPVLVQTTSIPTEVVDSELNCNLKDNSMDSDMAKPHDISAPGCMDYDKGSHDNSKYDTPVAAKPKSLTKVSVKLPTPESSDKNNSFHNDYQQLPLQCTQGKLHHPKGDRIIKINSRIYKRLELIGRGGSSKVFKIISQDGRKFLALKKVSLRGADSAAIKGYLSEIDFLKRLRKNNCIITLIDYQVSLSEGFIHMILEYGEIDLARLCHKYKSSAMSLNSIRMYWEQMLNAVHAIHKKNIIHSDLKPANFLLVEGALKLIDFGIARSIPNDTTNVHRDYQTGTINYMAPEAISFIEKHTNSTNDHRSYIKLGRASDVWSLGCILYQMVYGNPPFAHLDTIIKKLQCIVDTNHQISFPETILVERNFPNNLEYTNSKNEGDNSKITVNVDASIISAIKGCLVRVPRERMTIPQLLEHELLVPKNCSVPSKEQMESFSTVESLRGDVETVGDIVREVIVTSVKKLNENITPSALLAISGDMAEIVNDQLRRGEKVDLSEFRNTSHLPQ